LDANEPLADEFNRLHEEVWAQRLWTMRQRQGHKMRRSTINQHFKLLDFTGFIWDASDLLAHECNQFDEGVWALRFKEIL
jgi:hypothetical protein